MLSTNCYNAIPTVLVFYKEFFFTIQPVLTKTENQVSIHHVQSLSGVPIMNACRRSLVPINTETEESYTGHTQ